MRLTPIILVLLLGSALWMERAAAAEAAPSPSPEMCVGPEPLTRCPQQLAPMMFSFSDSPVPPGQCPLYPEFGAERVTWETKIAFSHRYNQRSTVIAAARKAQPGRRVRSRDPEVVSARRARPVTSPEGQPLTGFVYLSAAVSDTGELLDVMIECSTDLRLEASAAAAAKGSSYKAGEVEDQPVGDRFSFYYEFGP